LQNEVLVAPRSDTEGKPTTRTPSPEGHGGNARPDIPVVLCIGIATAPSGFGHRSSSVWTVRWVTSVSEVVYTQPTNADAIRSRPLRGAWSTVRYHRRSLVNRQLRLSVVRTGSIRGSDHGLPSSEGGPRYDLGYRHVEAMEKSILYSAIPRDRLGSWPPRWSCVELSATASPTSPRGPTAQLPASFGTQRPTSHVPTWAGPTGPHRTLMGTGVRTETPVGVRGIEHGPPTRVRSVRSMPIGAPE
jgi:hypothetical protein